MTSPVVIGTRSRALVVGWFSFELMGSTCGDVVAKDLLCEWLADAGLPADVAVWEDPQTGEIQLEDVQPDLYDHVIFVCGPIGDGPPINAFLERFGHARRLALNVSLLQEREEWNPFAAIVERDSSERTNPDITFAAPSADVPVAGLILVGPQDEYPTHRHDEAEAALRGLLARRDIAVLEIDTRLDVNAGGLRTAAQIESLIARMDVVVTTRLHGAAFAIRRGVPALVVDSIPGGTKLLRQMRCIGWPLAFDVAELHRDELESALDLALSAEGRALAEQCAARARSAVEEVRQELVGALEVLP